MEAIASGKVGLVRGFDIARHLVLSVVTLGIIYFVLYLA